MEFIELVDNIFGRFQTNYLNNLNVVYIQKDEILVEVTEIIAIFKSKM